MKEQRPTIDLYKALVESLYGDKQTPASTEYMVICNSGGSVFVKTKAFYLQQGGDRLQWGKNWVQVTATSIEDAREQGCNMKGKRSENPKTSR